MLYFGMAKLGQLLALPAGNITPVWIASRIILATVLLRGHYIWPGILLGALRPPWCALRSIAERLS